MRLCQNDGKIMQLVELPTAISMG